MRNDQPRAFPRTENGSETHTEFGMTLRQYYAAKAMQAYVTPEILMRAYTEEEIEREFTNTAAFAFRMADAMIAAEGE